MVNHAIHLLEIKIHWQGYTNIYHVIHLKKILY